MNNLMFHRLAASLLFLLTFATANCATAAEQYGSNLLVNGDAESVPAAPNAVTTFPGWNTDGNVTILQYGVGDFPSPSAPGPSPRGNNFFYGGSVASSSASQSISLSFAALSIDAGAASAELSAWIGGFSNQEDNAAISATFYDASLKQLGTTATIGPVSAADRGGVTQLLQRSATVAVPAGARSATVKMNFARLSGTVSDSYVDNVSLVLSQTTAPLGGTAFDVVGTSSGGDSNLTLNAALTMASAHVGQKGEVYVAALFKGAWYFNNKTGWQAQLSAYQSGLLPASMSIPVVGGMNVSSLPGLELYVGYGLNVTEMISASRYKKIYTVSGGTPYIQGELFGQDAFFTQASDAASKTTGALLQAVLAVNSVLYTDPAVSDVSTFKERKDAADKALTTLQSYAQQAENAMAQVGSGSLSLAAQPKNVLSVLNPDDVLATVASGSSRTQLRTLMNKYGVGAREAKTILDNAMAGLISDYNNTANFYNNAARGAQLVKDGSGLALTVVGAVATAGGVTGTLTVVEAAETLITGADAIVKVTKSGLELIKGADIPQPEGTVGAVLTVLSDVSEVYAVTNLWKADDPLKPLSNQVSHISNWVTIEQKRIDALASGELNLGAHTFSLKPLGLPLPAAIRDKLSPPQGTIPSTMTGKYRVDGKTVEVSTLPEAVNDVIAMLPEADRLPQIVNKAPTTPSGTALTPTYVSIAYNLPLQSQTGCFGGGDFSKSLTFRSSPMSSSDGSITMSGSKFTLTKTGYPDTVTCSGTFIGTTATQKIAMDCSVEHVPTGYSTFEGVLNFSVAGDLAAGKLAATSTGVGSIVSGIGVVANTSKYDPVANTHTPGTCTASAGSFNSNSKLSVTASFK